MRGVLAEQRDYPYLGPNARARLAAARSQAVAANVTQESLVSVGGDTWVLFPWLGTYAFLALERVIKLKLASRLGIKGVDVSRPYFIQFRMAATPKEFLSALEGVFLAELDPMGLLFPGELPTFDKYDEFLPPELVRKGFAEGTLDIEGARERALGWSGDASFGRLSSS